MRKIIVAAALMAAGTQLGGCALLVAGGAGAVAYDEGVVEEDGEFDPLEDVIDYDDDEDKDKED